MVCIVLAFVFQTKADVFMHDGPVQIPAGRPDLLNGNRLVLENNFRVGAQVGRNVAGAHVPGPQAASV